MKESKELTKPILQQANIDTSKNAIVESVKEKDVTKSKLELTPVVISPKEVKRLENDVTPQNVQQKQTEIKAVDEQPNVSIPEVKDIVKNQNTVEVSPLELVITKPTELTVTTSVDWIAFLGFAITAIIVLFANRQTVKHSAKLIKSQEAISASNAKENIHITKSEITATNRQNWINTLRDDLANFIGAMNSIWDLNRVKTGRAEVLKELKKPEYVMTELYNWSIKSNSFLQNAESLSAKIKLLVNPNEKDSKALCSLLDEAMKAVRSKVDPKDINNEIIKVSQTILKEEWERVKDLK